jgi:hypothetical protein
MGLQMLSDLAPEAPFDTAAQTDSPCPRHFTARDLLVLGYDMRKPHNYLAVIADTLEGDEPHLLDRYNHNRSTLCGQEMANQAFDVMPQGSSFCPDCYSTLVWRTLGRRQP